MVPFTSFRVTGPVTRPSNPHPIVVLPVRVAVPTPVRILPLPPPLLPHRLHLLLLLGRQHPGDLRPALSMPARALTAPPGCGICSS